MLGRIAGCWKYHTPLVSQGKHSFPNPYPLPSNWNLSLLAMHVANRYHNYWGISRSVTVVTIRRERTNYRGTFPNERSGVDVLGLATQTETCSSGEESGFPALDLCTCLLDKFWLVLTEAKKILKKPNCRLLENYFCTFIKHLSFQMVTTLGECMQHALKQGKSEGKSHSISLLTSIIELPRTVFQEYTINTVNTKLLHQILSSVCLKARHDVNFCSFCNWQHHIILKAWTLLLVSTATKTVSLMLFA